MLKRCERTTLLIGTILLLPLLLAACSGVTKPQAGLTSTPVEREIDPPTETPPPTLLLNPTPVPTARPLIEEQRGAGVYRNTTLGVSMDYPPDWRLIEADESPDRLAQLINPAETIYVYLETELIPEDMDAVELNSEFFAWLTDELNFASVRWTTSWTETQSDGTPIWVGLGEGTYGSPGEATVFEVVGLSHGTRNFRLIIVGSQADYEASKDDLDSIRRSLRVFSPLPYGIDRRDALFLASGEPITLDPARWLSDAGGIIGDLFSGLVQLDTNLQPMPDLAERWEISEDGLVYTFYLRPGLTFHDGSPVTAEDVRYSWERAANPETESNTAKTYLGDIVGVLEVIEGETTEIRGVRIIDDLTIEVTLDSPKVYFLHKLAYPTSWIVDRETVEEIEESPNGTGPFELVRRDEQVIILARNSNYHRGFVPLEYLVYLLYPGPRVRLYESGEIDLIAIDEDLLDRVHDASDPLFGSAQPANELCTSYVIFDVSRPPFDDLLVRKAFAQAIDKERYNEIVQEGRGVPANGLYPPGLPGYDPSASPIAYDPQAARDSLAASSYGGSANLPEIVFTTGGAGFDLAVDDALLIQMWEETLDLDIRVEQLDSDSFLEEVYAGNHGQILFMGWCADYPDPENFADILFHSESLNNHGHYSNPEADALLEQARAESDVERRLALYRKAEQILIDDVAAVFIDHSRAYYLVTKPYVHGFVATPIGVAQLMNVWIERKDE